MKHGQFRVKRDVQLLDGAVILDCHPFELHRCLSPKGPQAFDPQVDHQDGSEPKAGFLKAGSCVAASYHQRPCTPARRLRTSAQTTLTFSTNNWSTAQTVTATVTVTIASADIGAVKVDDTDSIANGVQSTL